MLKTITVFALLLGSLSAQAHEPAKCDDQPVSLRAMMRGMGNEMKALAAAVLKGAQLDGQPIEDVAPLAKNAKSVAAWLVLSQDRVPSTITAIPDETAKAAALAEYNRLLAEAITASEELAVLMNAAEPGPATEEMQLKLRVVLAARKDGHTDFKPEQ